MSKVRFVLDTKAISRQILKSDKLDQLLKQKYVQINKTNYDGELYQGVYRKVAGHPNKAPLTEEKAKAYMKTGSLNQKKLAKKYFASKGR